MSEAPTPPRAIAEIEAEYMAVTRDLNTTFQRCDVAMRAHTEAAQAHHELGHRLVRLKDELLAALRRAAFTEAP
jgi:hypothetical protein